MEQINTLRGHRTLPSGVVSVDYEKKDGGITFKVVIPEGQSATFRYGDEEYPLAAGENILKY